MKVDVNNTYFAYSIFIVAAAKEKRDGKVVVIEPLIICRLGSCWFMLVFDSTVNTESSGSAKMLGIPGNTWYSSVGILVSVLC